MCYTFEIAQGLNFSKERVCNMLASGRKTEISLLNVVLCLLVVFIHFSSAPVSLLDKHSLQYIIVMVPWRLSAFVVQGFIFLSGLKFFLKGTDSFSYGKFISKRAKTILIPYLIWVMAYYLYFCSIDYFPFDISDYVKYAVTGSIVSPFYFIIAIFQFYLLMPVWIRLFKKFDTRLLLIMSFLLMVISKKYLPVILGDTFKYYDRIFTAYIFYWFLGCAAGLNYNGFKAVLSRLLPACTVFFLVFAVVDIHFSVKSLVYEEYIPFLENLHVLYCISAILFLYGALSTLSKHIQKLPSIVNGIDSASFYIYLSHCFVMNVIDYRMQLRGIYGVKTTYVIRFISVYIITVSLCILYVKLKKKIILRR